MSAARIELVAAGNYAERRTALDAVLQPALSAAKGAGIRHVSVRIDAGDDAGIHALERHGFLNVDALVTFGLRLDAAAASSGGPGVRVRPVEAADVQQVGEIAAEAFRDGRFHADPDISADAGQRVYRSWAIACCEGAAAEAVLVASGAEGVRGFVACRMQADTVVHLQRPAGRIVMIATAAPARGRGVGTDLIAAAVLWFMERNAVAVEVGTQLRNVAAARLYERFGFRLVAGALSFRSMLDK
jgi:dTDP-4-amino-4,6-dideoxy-D-galactose acyltransferase